MCVSVLVCVLFIAVSLCRLYIVIVIRPYIPLVFLGAAVLGAGAGGGCGQVLVGSGWGMCGQEVGGAWWAGSGWGMCGQQYVTKTCLYPKKVLWTAQGQIMIQNSSKERMGTTSNIFWLMLQSRYGYHSYVFFICVGKGDI